MKPITISGYAGCGKSTVAELLSQKLSIGYLPVGQIYRQFAQKEGTDLICYTKNCELGVDNFVNAEIIKAAKDGNVIIDSRIGSFLCPESIKIWIRCSDEEAAKRIAYRNSSKNIEIPESVVLEQLKERNSNTRERLIKRYGFDLNDLSIYDLILNNEKLSKEQTLDVLYHYIRLI